MRITLAIVLAGLAIACGGDATETCTPDPPGSVSTDPIFHEECYRGCDWIGETQGAACVDYKGYTVCLCHSQWRGGTEREACKNLGGCY
jgi:hypothetical protein